jgi:hypothetical protein
MSRQESVRGRTAAASSQGRGRTTFGIAHGARATGLSEGERDERMRAGGNSVVAGLGRALRSTLVRVRTTVVRGLAVAPAAFGALASGAGALALLSAAPVLAQNVGETVAVLELAAPVATEFTLRGTIPVPPGTYPRPDGRSPFQVRSHDGTLQPAQVEHVSSYPLDSQGSDVVEVLARVKRSIGSTPGQYIRFDVVYSPHVDAPPQLTPRVASLRNGARSVILRTRDVYGNMYRSDLRLGALGNKELKSGSALLQERCYDVLRPVPSANLQTALPRLMGVHSYFTYVPDEDVVQLDLRIHNATSGADHSSGAVLDDVQNELYFDQLELVVPEGWVILPDFAGPSYGPPRLLSDGRMSRALVKFNDDGTYHVMGKQSQFLRRVALARVGHEARGQELVEERFLGFCRMGVNAQGNTLWSWWNPATARYFPQRQQLPDLTYMGDVSGLNTTRGKLSADFDHLADFFTTGASMNNYPIYFPRMGWAHPWGVAYGGMTGGTEVTLYDGFVTAYAASNPGYRYALMRHRMYTDRMCDALFNMDGEPTQVFDWLVNGATGQFLPGNFYQFQLSGTDMLGWNQAPDHHVNFAQSNGLKPSYESQLLAFKAVDLQHLVRYLNSPKVMAWLANDSVAKDDILMQAEISRMSYHHTPNNSAGVALGSTMLGDMQFVAAHPGMGFSFGRGEGWMVDAMCAAYSLGTPAWRQQARDWFERISELVYDGRVSCTGMIQAVVNTKILNGQFRARQSIEQAIVENALWSMRESVFRGVDPVRMGMLKRVIEDSAYTMVGFPGWSVTGNGPHNHVAIGPVDLNQAMFCTTLPEGGTTAGGVDKHQSWSTLAYGYRLTGDTLFLQRAMQMAGPQFTTFQSSVEQGFMNIENRCALLALQHIQFP